MNKFHLTMKVLAITIFTFAFASAVQAQASRTWVSGTGNDVDPCSRTAPCKTWSGAQSKTAAGGEIDALDPGGYGAITITKALTIDGTAGAGFGGSLAAGTNGFTINITTGQVNDKVVLRNLSINGNNTAGNFHGIRFLDGAELTVENVDIFNFNGDGINVSAPASRIHIKNVRMNRVFGAGVRVTSATGQSLLTLEDSSIHASTTGLDAGANVRAAVKNTTFDSATICIQTTGSLSIINADDLFLTYCTTAVQASPASTINIGDSMIVQNATGLNLNGGTINSMQGNTLFSNTTPGAFSFTQVKQ